MFKMAADRVGGVRLRFVGRPGGPRRAALPPPRDSPGGEDDLDPKTRLLVSVHTELRSFRQIAGDSSDEVGVCFVDKARDTGI